MKTAFRRCVLGLCAVLAAAALLAACGSPLWAQGSAMQAIGQHLAAGEFPLARRLAQQLPAPQRDRVLGQIARAQAQAGMFGSAVSSLADIGNDRYRSQMAQELSGQRFSQAAAGGGVQADFQQLIDLITRTIEPDTWDPEGQGTVEQFAIAGGVRIDAGGTVHSVLRSEAGRELLRLQRSQRVDSGNRQVWRSSPLRKVSLTRLEKYVQLRLALGQEPDEAMRYLAGLTKIQYVFVYPESGDIVLAGPAGPWTRDELGRVVNADSGRPVLHLDDLVVLLRAMRTDLQAALLCSIEPEKENLVRVQQFLAQKRRLTPATRRRWVEQIRQRLGWQSVRFQGIDPRTRVAHVMFEADYRMKLLGIGLEPGPPQVPSYLEQIRWKRGQKPPAMGMLRWWFNMNYEAVLASADRNAYALRGQGVEVLSESEMITRQGGLVPAARQDPLAAAFAANFTRHFDHLAAEYHVYADLQNVFDLALVCALLQAEGIPERVNWNMTCFGDPQQYPVALGPAPRKVESVANYRVLGGRHVVVAVSGGVRLQPARYVKQIATDRRGELSSRRQGEKPQQLPRGVWWWD